MEYSKEILDFIDFDEEKYICYIHRTSTEQIAQKILRNGFEFADAILKTTDVVVNDIVVLKYLHNLRKDYGEFNILICIANDIYDRYLKELRKMHKEQEYSVEEILADIKPRFDEDRDQWIYTLPKYYIKGYFCEETFKIIKNIDFNPYYDSERFQENIKNLG